MKQSPYLYLLPCLMAVMISSKMAYTQSNMDTLWSLLKSARPIAESSPVWELAGKKQIQETCISGDCTNGYGISIANDGGVAGRYQYEGGFLNAKHQGVGIIKTANGLTRVGHFENGKIAGAYLLENNGLLELHQANAGVSQMSAKEFGFSLADVLKHQAKSFEKFTPCNCLVRATHIVVEEYQQPYELTDQFKNYKGTGYRTETRRVEYPGLRNNCSYTVFVKAISYKAGFYFDRSVAIIPGATIMKRPFNATYTPGKEGLQYLGQYEIAPVSK